MQAGFEEALLANFDMLHPLSRRLCDTSHDAEDPLQETCLSSWQAWTRRGAPDDASAWFSTICLNHARSRWRRRRTRPAESLVADVELATPTNSIAPVAVDDAALVNIDAALIREHLATLPYHQREAICLMDLSGFAAARTAEMLGVPRNTVLSRVHRGHRALAASLIDWAQTR